jgi:hypothetical protein
VDQNKMKKWSVPITVEIDGEITVEAETDEEALEIARQKYAKIGVDCPSIIESPAVDEYFGDVTEITDENSVDNEEEE